MSKVIEGGFDGGQVVPDPSEERLTSRQLVDYTEHRVRLLTWIENIGQSTVQGEGYAPDTGSGRTYRLDAFYRWGWEEEGRHRVERTDVQPDGHIPGDERDLQQEERERATVTHGATRVAVCESVRIW